MRVTTEGKRVLSQEEPQSWRQHVYPVFEHAVILSLALPAKQGWFIYLTETHFRCNELAPK